MKTVALGDVAVIERKAVNPRLLAPETLYLGLEHIERGGRIVGHGTIGGADLASTKFWFSPEHILFGKLRPNLGKICRPGFEGVCSTDILPIRPGNNIDRNYLVHYLSQPSMIDFAASRTSGANLPRLGPAVLSAFPVPLPPLAEQRRIAEILDHADALRAKRRLALDHLDGLASAMIQDLLSQTFPRVALGELISQGPKNGLYRPSRDYGSGTPIVRIDSFKFGSTLIDTASLKRLRASPNQVNEYALEVGDLLINRVNSRDHVGKTALVSSLSEPTIFESNMMRIRVDHQRLLPVFAAEFMQTRDARRQVAPMTKEAVNQASINQADVRGIKIPLPPVEVQHRYAESVKKVDDHRVRTARALAEGDSLFASLQSRAFRGEL